MKLLKPLMAVDEGFADGDILLGAQAGDVGFEFVGQRVELSAWLHCIVGLLHGGRVCRLLMLNDRTRGRGRAVCGRARAGREQDSACSV